MFLDECQKKIKSFIKGHLEASSIYSHENISDKEWFDV